VPLRACVRVTATLLLALKVHVTVPLRACVRVTATLLLALKVRVTVRLREPVSEWPRPSCWHSRRVRAPACLPVYVWSHHSCMQ
jgi:hypothetical protein